jgi:hypothetical protein
VPEELHGKLVKCPTCGKTFTAKAASAAPPAQLPVEELPPWEQGGQPYPIPSGGRQGGGAAFEEEDDGYEVVDDRDESRRRRRRRGRYLAPHRGNMILTLGVISLFIMHIPLGPIAWIMGNSDLAEIRAGRMDPEGESSTNTGRICGMISTILSIVSVAVVGLVLFCMFCGCAGIPILGGAGRPRP